MTKRRAILLLPAAGSTRDYRPSVSLANRVFDRDEDTCAYCNRQGVELCIDHVTPASWFAPASLASIVNAPENLVTACTACNLMKGGLDLDGFVRRLLALGVRATHARAMVARVKRATSRELPE